MDGSTVRMASSTLTIERTWIALVEVKVTGLAARPFAF
jgi:hypothetical protein